MSICDPISRWKLSTVRGGSYTIRELLVPVFKDGLCVYRSPEVMEIQKVCKRELDTLWEESRRLMNPHQVYVDLSDKLYDMKKKLFEEMSLKEQQAHSTSENNQKQE